MERPRRRRSAVAALLVGAVAVAGLLAVPAASAGAQEEPALPVVFVHGGSGSSAQYETQALRWASNDYPNLVTAIDRTSSTPATFYPQLDAFIDNVLAQTGAPQVYLAAHSLGTALSAGYLNSDPARAARVAKYIGIDGAQAATCPGGVPCMGIWARGNPARVLGTNNVYFPEQGHTQSVTSPESFAAQYEFFTGEAPATTEVLPQPPGQVKIDGRALNFPANTGLEGATLQLWKVNGSTGARTTSEPLAETVLGADGNFGPYRVNGQQRHELTVIRQGPDGPVSSHFYYEPWTRSNSLIRLNLSPIGSPLSNAIDTGPHAVASVVRQKEWWGNNPVNAADIDVLDITTTRPSGTEAAGNVLNAATAPYTSSTIAVITFDNNVDGVTDVSAPVPLQIFINGVDVYMPGVDPTDGSVAFRHLQRGHSTQQVINTPNWASGSGHSMTVTFREYEPSYPTWGSCKSAKAC